MVFVHVQGRIEGTNLSPETDISISHVKMVSTAMGEELEVGYCLPRHYDLRRAVPNARV